ncbi:MAG: T9SS type A sorting domain-containing protein [Flavobacteriales bacterium]|nr:T9SS type A sorting domain-containing protein [Flavobacteriales bacterium]
MKNFGLYLVLVLFTGVTFGQVPLNLEFNNLTIREDLEVDLNQPSGQLQIRSYGDMWFNLSSNLVEIGEIPNGILFPVSIFPDSTIIWDFDQLSDQPIFASIHGLADVINPSRTPSGWLDEWGNTVVDSILIPYLYVRNSNTSVVDTVLIDFLKSEPLTSYFDINGNSEYDDGEFKHMSIKHTGTTDAIVSDQVFRTDTILLTVNDSTYDVKIKELIIDVNDSVAAGNRYGVYIRFNPGYEWKANDDTLSNYNEFMMLAREQVKGETPKMIWSEDAGFCSYINDVSTRYNFGLFASSLIPGVIQNPGFPIEHIQVVYKLTTTALSVNEIDGFIEGVAIFPNPVRKSTQLNFKLMKTNQVDLKIYNSLGTLVLQKDLGLLNTGHHIHKLNVSQLPAGFYILRVNNISQKLVVK